MAQLEKIFSMDENEKLERVFISELRLVKEETIMLRGWVHKIIDLSHVVFVKLSSRTKIRFILLLHLFSRPSYTFCSLIH